jgi:hypothetical protein
MARQGTAGAPGIHPSIHPSINPSITVTMTCKHRLRQKWDTYQTPLFIVSAVDEHPTHITHRHGSVWLREGLVQHLVLALVVVSLVGHDQGIVHIPLLTQGLSTPLAL